jgi:pyruvate ferredoxin oxidoreductase delta subunit
MKITIGAVVKGKSSLDYKTGNWRDQRPVLDEERCKSCGQCVEVCPDSAVHVEDEVYVIDYDFCKGCGLCAYECPAEAIEMVQEEK